MRSFCPTKETIDVAAQVSGLEAYQFLAVSGTVTMTGYFLNAYGGQVGGRFSASVASSGAVTHFTDPALLASAGLTTITPGDKINDCVGAVIVHAAALYVGMRGSVDTDILAHPADYPQFLASVLRPLARVA